MKKSSIVFFAASLLALSVSTVKVSADDTTTPTPVKKPGVGGELKNGTEAVFKDFGKGVKKVGKGIDTGAKDTMKVTKEGAEKVGAGTEKTFSKVTHHKKADPAATTTSTTTTTTQSGQ